MYPGESGPENGPESVHVIIGGCGTLGGSIALSWDPAVPESRLCSAVALELPDQAGPTALDSLTPVYLGQVSLSAELEERSFVATGGVGQDM